MKTSSAGKRILGEFLVSLTMVFCIHRGCVSQECRVREDGGAMQPWLMERTHDANLIHVRRVSAPPPRLGFEKEQNDELLQVLDWQVQSLQSYCS
eukprot:543079-Amphidinium_carterae.1